MSKKKQSLKRGGGYDLGYSYFGIRVAPYAEDKTFCTKCGSALEAEGEPEICRYYMGEPVRRISLRCPERGKEVHSFNELFTSRAYRGAEELWHYSKRG